MAVGKLFLASGLLAYDFNKLALKYYYVYKITFNKFTYKLKL